MSVVIAKWWNCSNFFSFIFLCVFSNFSTQHILIYIHTWSFLYFSLLFVFWILFIFYTADSYYLSILYILVYICQSQSPNSSHPCPPRSPLGVHTFVLYICVSISALQTGSLYHFSRFHIYALIYNICFSLSNFTLYDSL